MWSPMWEPDNTADGRASVATSTPPSRDAGPAAARNEPAVAMPPRPRAGWTTSDERALEHQRLARALDQSENEALRVRRENAARGSTVDADYLFALSLAQEVNGPSRAGQQGARAQQRATPPPVPAQPAARQAGTPAAAAAAASAAPGPSSLPAAAAPAKKKGLLRSLSKSLRRKSSKSSIAPSLASDDSASTTAASATEQPEDHWQQPVAQPPAQPVPLNRQSPLGYPGVAQQPSQSSADMQSQDERSPPVQQQLSRDERPQPGRGSPMSASPAASTPVGVSPSESHDDEAIRPLSSASPLRPAGNGLTPTGSPTTAPISGEEGVDESGYRELLLDTQMLRQDLEKTLADKQHTMRRLEARGVELQADMHSVRHRIDDPAGWEAFSLYSQQQADLEGRLRLGKRQEDLLQSCMRQLQDLQAFVYERRPDPQDVVLLQDATFSELLRRLQKLDVDPQLPADGAAVAPPANSDAEDMASQLRAVCQSSANIDFGAALEIASAARTAKERQAGKDQAQEAASELLKDMAEDDTRQEPWQPPGADASPRASWHLAGGFDADEFEDASAELDDDLPDADYVVPHVAGPFSFQGLHAATASSQQAQPDSSPVPPMSESQSPTSVSDQDEWAAAAAAADAAPLDADFEGPTSMSRSSSFEEPEFWSPVYGAAAQPDSDPSPAAEDSMDAASAAGAAAASSEQSSSSAAVQPPAAPGVSTAADAVERPDPSTQSQNAPVSHAMDAELVARLAALSHRPSSSTHAPAPATSPATVAAAAPTPTDASSGSDLAQALQEAEARFLALGGSPQRAGPGTSAASAAPRQVQAQPQPSQQPDGLDAAAGDVRGQRQLVSHRLEAADDDAASAAAAEVSPATDGAAASAEAASDALSAKPMPEVPSSQAADGAGSQSADAAALEPDGVAAGSSPDRDEAQADQHAAPPQRPAGRGNAAAEAATVTVLQQQLSPLQRQDTGSGSFSFSFPAPAAIAAAAVGTSPREPPAKAEGADTELLEAARSNGRADQLADQRSRQEPEQAAASTAVAGDTETADTEPLSAAASDASAEEPAHPPSREEPEQAASSTGDEAAPAGEQATPQPDEVQAAPVAGPATVPDGTRAGSPAADSPTSNGSYNDRAAERRKRQERQAALEAQRQALAERRKLRSQSSGSSTEVFAAPEPPVVPPKDAKARVRFAVEEGEAPGDKPLDPEVVRVSPRSALKQTTQPSPRTSPRGSVQRTSPPSARPPAGMRSRGSQEQLTALMKADSIRRQLRDPVDAKRMTRIEKQFALMELQYLLGDHRASDRRQADALDQRSRGVERAGSLEDLARLPEAERARIREQRRRERDRERTRAGSSGGGGMPLGRRTSSDALSISGSDAGSGSVSTYSTGRSTEGRATRRGSIPTMPGNAGLRTVSIPSGSPGGGGQRAGSMSQANGSGSLDGAPRSGRRSGLRDASHDSGVAVVPAASLSEKQLQALALEYKNLALEIKDFEAVDLQDAARMWQRVQSATKGRPSPAAVGTRAWPARKAAALSEVVGDWNELQYLTTALKQWRMLPDFSCLDEGTRIETYMNVVKQTTSKMALSSAETQQRFAAASVPWSPDLLQGVRRAAMQPAKLYLERVLREVGNLGNSQSARANAVTLLRSALRLGAQVQQFTGGLDRDVSVLLKRVQNLQATIKP